MRVILDTHAFLWFIDDSPQLSTAAKVIIANGSNDIVLSVAGLWEMAIKISLGKLSISGPFGPYVSHQLTVNAIGLFPISLEHVAVVASLPFHHRDPFDRLLIAQALVEQIPLVSADQALDAYGIHRLW